MSVNNWDSKDFVARKNDRVELPKVSHFIVSYNQKNYIDDAIRSAVEQDYPNLEVVVSDDASTDGTAEIIANWKILYPDRIVAILNKINSGITSNCNKALEACSGEFISLQGGDDILLPGKISAQVEWFSKSPKRVLCGHRLEVFYDDGSGKSSHLNVVGFKPGSGPVALIKKGVPYGGTSIMVRASEIPKHGFDESVSSASDLIFYIETLMRGGEYGELDGVYARYRRHGNNITTKRLEMIFDLKKTYEVLGSRYPEYRKLCNKMLIEHYIYSSGVVCLNEGRRAEARAYFIETLKKRPFFIRGWIRLLQSI